MSDLSAKFTTLEEQLATQNALIAGYIDTVEAKLQLIADEIDTLSVNGAANTKYLLSALSQINPCVDCGDRSLVIPPTIGTGIPISPEQCKRIQAFLHTMQEVFTVLDVVSTFSVALDFSLLNNSINEVITSIESGSDLPVISFPEGVQLVGDLITYGANNLLVGSTLSSYFSSIYFDLRSGMAFGSSASSMQAAYNGVVDGSSLPSYVKPVIKDAAYNALYSYYFDPGTEPNLTGYDGSVCGGSILDITGCTDFVTTSVTVTGETWQFLQTSPETTTPVSWGILGDFNGWTFEKIDGPTGLAFRIFSMTPSGLTLLHSINDGEGPFTFVGDAYAGGFISLDHDTGVPFVIRVCPPS